MVPDMTVLGDAVAGPGRRRAPRRGGARGAARRPDVRAAGCSTWRGQERLDEVDLADLLGMADARFAVEVAAAGGHHLLLTGPKGCRQDHASPSGSRRSFPTSRSRSRWSSPPSTRWPARSSRATG